MGMFSDVGVAVKKDLLSKLSASSMKLLKECNSVFTADVGSLFYFEDIKWYHQTDHEIAALYEELSSLDEDGDSFLIVEACHGYPASDEGDSGGWLDNPWNLRRSISVCLSFDEGAE